MHLRFIGDVRAHAMFLSGVLLYVGMCFSVAAQDPNDITLRLNSTTATAGGTAEVTVELATEGVLPTTLVLFIAYDEASIQPFGDAYELIARDPFSGAPLLDSNGNTIASRSAIRPNPDLAAGSYGVDYQVHSGFGVISISILSPDADEIPAGDLVTLAFNVGAAVADGSMVDVMGVVEGAEILLPDGSGVKPFATSASSVDAVPLTCGYENTTVDVGCEPAEVPAGVTATRNRSDGVLVSWSPSGTPGAQYRVYRSTSNSPASAAPIGEDWQTATSFLDITARVPEVDPGDGCQMPPMVNEIHYFYWVRARSETGCESGLSSGSAEGFRTEAKRQLSSAGLGLMQGGAAGRLVAFAVVLGAFLAVGPHLARRSA